VNIWKKALTDTELTNMTSTNASVSQSAVKTTTVGADGSSFQADLKSTLDLQAGVGKPTFTRATIATVIDFEGLIKNVKSGEARFEGARRVENLITTNTNSLSSALTAIGASPPTVTNQTGVTLPDGTVGQVRQVVWPASGDARVRLTATGTGVGGSYVGSVWFKNASGGIWARISPAVAIRTGTIYIDFIHSLMSGYGATDYVAFGMMEDVTGQANQNPSEYVSTGVKTSAPYHGANVDGVKYFTTYNGNTVSSNVVTEATGANIPDATLHGYVAEGARTNLLTNSNNF